MIPKDEVLNLAKKIGIPLGDQESFDGKQWTENVRLVFDETQLLTLANAIADRQREVDAQICEERIKYNMPIPCPDGIHGCCVMHCVPATREKTGKECAEAILTNIPNETKDNNQQLVRINKQYPEMIDIFFADAIRLKKE